MKVCSEHSFVSGLLYLAVDHSFSFLSGTTPYEYISIIDVHLGYFQFGAVTNIAAMNITMNIVFLSWCIFPYNSVGNSWGEIAGSYICVFGFHK